MSFMQPDLPEAEIAPEPDPVLDQMRRRELAINRSRKRSLQVSRENLVLDPSTRTSPDAGLAIRR